MTTKIQGTQGIEFPDSSVQATAAAIPPGTIIDFAGTVAPAGFLACPVVATNISRATYAALFAAIGTTWGVGNGSTTFGMPYFPSGYTAVHAPTTVAALTIGQIIAHTHGLGNQGIDASGSSFASILASSGVRQSLSPSGSTGVDSNYPAAMCTLKCVKI